MDEAPPCRPAGAERSPPEATAATRTLELAGLEVPPEIALGPGVQVGEYTLERMAGQGGMGTVWRASRSGRVYAIKTVRTGRGRDLAALKRELALLQRINRADFFPTVHEHRQVGDRLFVVMDWVEGQTLRDFLLGEPPRLPELDVAAFEQLMTRILDRLSYLHTWPGGGILFRDLKPRNIMVGPDLGVKLVDFGISHLAGQASVMAGSRGYLAPEVALRGEASVRTDLFSLGRVGLFLLFGHEDFDQLTPESRPPLYGQRRLGPALVRAMLTLAAERPSDRPEGCAEALQLLREALSEGPAPLGEVQAPGARCALCRAPCHDSALFCPWCGACRDQVPEEALSEPSATAEASAALPGPALRSLEALQLAPPRAFTAYRSLLAARAASDLTRLRCLAHLRVQPYAYQKEAAIAVVARQGGKALLADDVGLGKTIEAGLIVREQMLRGFARRVLIVSPPGVLLEQIRLEMQEKFDLSFWRFTSQEAAALAERDLVIVSRALLSRSGEALRQVEWDTLVVDECHHFTNPATKQWWSLRQLAARARSVLLLSATPFRGDPEQLWALFSILDPGVLGNEIKDFRKRFVLGPRSGRQAPTQALRETVARYTIRRRRTDIGGGIPFPGRDAVRVAVALPPEEASLHRAVSAAIAASGSNGFVQATAHRQLASSYQALARGALLQRLDEATAERLQQRTDASHPKVRALLDRVVPRLPRDEKFLVFTHFQESQRSLAELLRQRGVGVIDLLGKEPIERMTAVQRFREDPSAQAMVCGEGAGEGLNLQFCSILVNFDLPWNPMRLEQRIGRIQRLGQRRKRVSVVNLVLADTIEDRVLQILTDRLAIFRQFMGETEQVLGKLLEGEEDGAMAFEAWIARLVLENGRIDEQRALLYGLRIEQAMRQVEQERQQSARDADQWIGTPGPASAVPAPSVPPLDLSFLGED